MNPATITETVWNWYFPGGIPGLCIAAAVLVLFLIISYVFTLRKLSFRKKVLPLTLRILFVLALLLCLSNPSRSTIRKTEFLPELKIAVIFDESASMTKPSDSGTSRLQDAIIAVESKIKPFSGKAEYFAFGKTMRKISSIRALPDQKSKEAKANADTTDLKSVFQNGISLLSSERFHGAIWFTDGIDTEGTQKEQLMAMVGGAAIEHVFVPMTRSLPSEAELSFRKVEFPENIQTGTDAQALFLIRGSNLTQNNTGVFELIRNQGEVIHRQALPNGTGLHTIRCILGADTPGKDTLTARLLLNGKIREQTMTTIDKIKPGDLANVLIFNGAPDFGTRFIRNVFRDRAEMAFDIRYAEGVFPRIPSKNNIFPTLEELEKYDVVLLMNLRKNNLRKGAAADLDAFVKKGGGLLFVCGNPLTAREFAASELEKLLPVTFHASPPVDRRVNPETEAMVNGMGTNANSFGRIDTRMLKTKEFTFRPAPTYRFQLTETGKRSPIFVHRGSGGQNELLSPEYQDSALVSAVKPGTNVLASGQNGTPILACQNYGAGRSMVLACDPLWRWKMNLPSDKTDYEIFWKNVFSYLATRRNPYTGFAVANAAPGRKEWKFVLDSRSEDPSALSCEAEQNGNKHAVPLLRDGSKTFCMVSVEPGENVLRAFNKDGKEVASVRFSAESHSNLPPEMRILDPDYELFHALSNLPNVTLANTGTELDPAQLFGIEKTSMEERTDRPLWHTWIVFGILLMLICLEWGIRRMNNLL